MTSKEEYDFIEDTHFGTYQIYNKRSRGNIIAVCENVFDAQIVVKALTNGLSSVEDMVDEARKEGIEEGKELGSAEAYAETKATLFDPS